MSATSTIFGGNLSLLTARIISNCKNHFLVFDTLYGSNWSTDDDRLIVVLVEPSFEAMIHLQLSVAKFHIILYLVI